MRRVRVAAPVLFAIACSYAPACEVADPIAADARDAASAPDAAPDRDASDDAAADLAARRARCEFGAGSLATESLGGAASAARIPIDTFVIVYQENRSFDHYLSRLPEAGQTDVDVAAPDVGLTGADGTAVERYHEPRLCIEDVRHNWDVMHEAFNDGRMDLFAVVNKAEYDPAGRRALAWYDAKDLPLYYALATTYAISDRFFSSVLGPTGTNKKFMYAATSRGDTSGEEPIDPNAANIFKLLRAHGVPTKVYTPWAGSGGPDKPCEEGGERGRYCQDLDPALDLDGFERDAEAGTLPKVAWVNVGADEHPPESTREGERAVHRILSALVRSPQWRRSAFFLSYDESGGFYDHVVPPRACKPDDAAPILAPGVHVADFDRYGFRVPLIVVSPFARPRYVSHAVNSHASVLRLLEARFEMPAMTARDGSAAALLDLFDFDHPSFETPTLPALPPEDSRGCPTAVHGP
jgi:phospholipase C